MSKSVCFPRLLLDDKRVPSVSQSQHLGAFVRSRMYGVNPLVNRPLFVSVIFVCCIYLGYLKVLEIPIPMVKYS